MLIIYLLPFNLLEPYLYLNRRDTKEFTGSSVDLGNGELTETEYRKAFYFPPLQLKT